MSDLFDIGETVKVGKFVTVHPDATYPVSVRGLVPLTAQHARELAEELVRGANIADGSAKYVDCDLVTFHEADATSRYGLMVEEADLGRKIASTCVTEAGFVSMRMPAKPGSYQAAAWSNGELVWATQPVYFGASSDMRVGPFPLEMTISR